MTYAVRFENVTKRYPRGGPRYASLRQDLSGAMSRLGQRLRGERVASRGTLALEDVSFEVKEGESFAIIGPNGAGKTTALKLISRISYPTGGEVRVRGRVGALIEVGSGIHPELTGRENIWLYGRILGMKRPEVARRFEEIVEFAELGDVLDTPVKMYSSGMQLRLGFAIASHVDPDVFVVDEALAVGDAGFQAKCAARMTQLVAEGRTLLFVSHNLSAVEAVCSKGLFVLEGKVRTVGSVRESLAGYLKWVDAHGRRRISREAILHGRGLDIESVSCHTLGGDEQYAFRPGDGVVFCLHVRALDYIRSPWFSIGISDGRPGTLALCSMLENGTAKDLPPGSHLIECKVHSLPLNPRTYELWVSVREETGSADLVDWRPIGSLRVDMPPTQNGPGSLTTPWVYGPLRLTHEWNVKSTDG
jgi:ABC-type polysaccharide/polyol phosphate transport system ATPase subunit